MGFLQGAMIQGVLRSVYVWGVYYDGTSVYASDMLNGLWKLTPVVR